MRSESDSHDLQFVAAHGHTLDPEPAVFSGALPHRRCFGVQYDERIAHGPANLIADGAAYETRRRLRDGLAVHRPGHEREAENENPGG
jgi:hypothetical protein